MNISHRLSNPKVQEAISEVQAISPQQPIAGKLPPF
jgi:hypothetical protein